MLQMPEASRQAQPRCAALRAREAAPVMASDRPLPSCALRSRCGSRAWHGRAQRPASSAVTPHGKVWCYATLHHCAASLRVARPAAAASPQRSRSSRRWLCKPTHRPLPRLEEEFRGGNSPYELLIASVEIKEPELYGTSPQRAPTLQWLVQNYYVNGNWVGSVLLFLTGESRPPSCGRGTSQSLAIFPNLLVQGPC